MTAAGLASAWYAAGLTWLGIPLGCLMLLLTWHVMGGRVLAQMGGPVLLGARLLPMALLLLLPAAFHLPELFPWARADFVEAHREVAAKSAWLGPTAVLLRASLYAVVLCTLAVGATRGLTRLDRSRRRPALGAAGAIVVTLVGSLAAVDWIMSLEPTFSSSVFGLYFLGGSALAGFAAALLATLHSAHPSEHPGILAESRLIGLGNTFLALALIWGYLAFMQWLVVWAGDTPDHAAWYVERSHGPWLALAWLCALAQGVVPVAALLSQRARTSAAVLAPLCGLVLLGHVLEMAWIVGPAFEPGAVWLLLLVAALAVTGAILLLPAARQVRRLPRHA